MPLIVMECWGFPLVHIETEEDVVFAVQDWMRGLSGEETVSGLWGMFKRTKAAREILNSIESLPYKASDGKTYKMVSNIIDPLLAGNLLPK